MRWSFSGRCVSGGNNDRIAELPEFGIFQKSVIGGMDGDHQSRQAVQESGMQDIAGKEGGQGAEQDLEEGWFFSLQVHAFCGQRAVAVDLGDMILLVGIGEMEEIAFEGAERRVFDGFERFMDELGVPFRFPPFDQAQFPIRVPTAMANPPAAVVAKPFHPVSVVGKAAFFFLQDTIF